EFKIKCQLTPNQHALALKIQEANSVCLNVRRADFVNNPLANQFHGFCDSSYLQKAAERILGIHPEVAFYVFSDDIAWCQSNLQLPAPTTFVDHSFKGQKFETYLYLMTLCNHFVIPNSTFGWWAAWLASNKQKIVIAPENWFVDKSIVTSDLIPQSWIRL
ncbi:MAG: alpha-1,2-fucosyltransferase, partial [Bdellovibrionales bacterium]|nr:alpha-1,2-fucosyltransferase [Bdellovibrionales bacterium]